MALERFGTDAAKSLQHVCSVTPGSRVKVGRALKRVTNSTPRRR